jgi:hypothetical protein
MSTEAASGDAAPAEVVQVGGVGPAGRLYAFVLDTLKRLRTSSEPAQWVAFVDLAADTTFRAPYPRAIYVGTAGNLKVDAIDSAGVPLTAKTIKAGDFSRHDIECITKIYSTGNGTTASDIVAYG